MGKAHLAPIKSVTIPQLELTDASVSIRVGEMLRREIDGNPELMYHTDSTTVQIGCSLFVTIHPFANGST